MSLLGFWGFDDTAVAEYPLSSNLTGNAVGRTSGRAHNTGHGQTNVLLFTNPIPADTRFIFGCALLTNASTQAVHLPFVNVNGNPTAPLVDIGIVKDNLTQVLTFTFYVNNVNVGSYRGYQDNTWFYFELEICISSTNGVFNARINGHDVFSYSGNTGNDSTYGIAWYSTGSSLFIIDDTYLLDENGTEFNDFLGDIVVKQVVPGSNGVSSEFTNSAGTSVNNYSYVDSAGSQSTQYVEAAAAGDTDLYGVVPLNISDIPLAIQSLTYGQKTDGGASPNMAPISRGVNGTERTDPTLNLSATTWQNLPGEVYTTDPDGNALTSAAVNGMQIGVVSQ